MFAIMRFRYIEGIFRIHYYYWVKKIIRYTGDFEIIEVRNIEVALYSEIPGYIEGIFHILYYYWGKENHSLYRGLRNYRGS